MSGESAAIRWSPAQRVESVLLSVLSLLDDANISSPANVDASVMFRDQPEKFREMVAKDLETCKKDIPEGFVMPTAEAYNAKKETQEYIMDDWGDSDEGADFDFDDEDDDMDFDGSGSGSGDDAADGEHDN